MRLETLETRDPDEMSAALQHAQVQYLPLKSSGNLWQLEHLPLAEGRVYVGRMGAAMTGFGSIEPGLVGFAFRLAGAGRWTMNGCEIDGRSVAVRFRAREVSLRLDDRVRWAVVYLSEAWLHRHSRVGTGRDAELQPGVRVYRPARSALERLRLLVATGLSLGRSGAGEPHDWRALEEAITEEAAAVLESSSQPGHCEYARLIAPCNEFLAAHPGERLQLADLSAALEISERTLRRFFSAAYGSNPTRFLRLRRLMSVRRMLLAAPGATGAITQVATSHGFFELGRFAANYREAVGESPSETLREARARAG